MVGEPSKSLLVRCPGHRTRVVHPGQRLSLGRHPSNDLVLHHLSVSRFHAAIRWEDGNDVPVLLDQGSANGVVLDGKPVVKGALLTPGPHRVRLGEVRLGVELQRHLRDEGEAALLPGQDRSDSVALIFDHGPEYEGVAADGAALRRLLISLQADQRSGTLCVQGRRTIEVVLSGGRIVHARCGPETGRPALRALLETRVAAYRFVRRMQVREAELDVEPALLIATEWPSEATAC